MVIKQCTGPSFAPAGAGFAIVLNGNSDFAMGTDHEKLGYPIIKKYVFYSV